MEGLPCNSSNTMMRGEASGNTIKPIKLRQICPAEMLQKEQEAESSGTANFQNTTINLKGVYSAGKSTRPTLQTVLHIRPIYSLGSFLKNIEIVGDCLLNFDIKKVRSFPSSKYTISNDFNSVFQLTSNFSGSKYSLTKDNITYLTIIFEVGCGKNFRSFSFFLLRSMQAWKSLLGYACTNDLSELYEKGSNYQQIGKYVSLQPTLCPQKRVYSMPFSRQGVIPCVQNAILCNSNGQKVLQMFKIDQNDGLFEIVVEKMFQIEVVMAIAIASFDFKIGLQ